MRRLFVLAAAVGLSAPAFADVKPNPLFSDNMVLQRGGECPVWGTADPGEQVTVKLARQSTSGIEMSSVSTTADKEGKWMAKVDAIKVGDGCTLTIKGKNEIEFKNVAVGDVWICSGQSNMEWQVRSLNRDGQGAKVAAAANYPNIRLFTVKKKVSMTPVSTVAVDKLNAAKDVWNGKWQPCTPDTAATFSAVGYFFGRDLEKALNVPIGLIHTSWGGTPAEAWTSKETLQSVPELKHYPENLDKAMKSYDPAKAEANYKAAMEKWEAASAKAKAAGTRVPQRPRKQNPPTGNPNNPSVLYNGMIAPLLPFAIKGAIWYQGESNAGRAAEYRTLMPTMIEDWRKKWGSDFPFFMVQLAPFRDNGSDKVNYAELRDAQYHTTKVLKKVGIAVITDVGEENNIHPQRKEPVGGRLAIAALGIAYGKPIEYSGPEYKSHTIDGGKVTITFDHVGKGLECKGDELAGFTLCGDDKKFLPAKAEIVGDKVVVSSPDVPHPTAVRFGWVNFAKPTLNFFNKDGLPAVPFRTDDFPLVTAKK
ncbi:MAG TPA: sialate O-acetylesterase [Fimbriiglobus sp.]|jgi:sialate O-acetylesterase